MERSGGRNEKNAFQIHSVLDPSYSVSIRILAYTKRLFGRRPNFHSLAADHRPAEYHITVLSSLVFFLSRERNFSPLVSRPFSVLSLKSRVHVPSRNRCFSRSKRLDFTTTVRFCCLFAPRCVKCDTNGVSSAKIIYDDAFALFTNNSSSEGLIFSEFFQASPSPACDKRMGWKLSKWAKEIVVSSVVSVCHSKGSKRPLKYHLVQLDLRRPPCLGQKHP